MELLTSPSPPAPGPWRKDPSLQKMAPKTGTGWARVPTGPCVGKNVQAEAEGWPRSTWWSSTGHQDDWAFCLASTTSRVPSVPSCSEREILLVKFTPPDPRDLPGHAPSFSFGRAGLSTPSNMTKVYLLPTAAQNKVVWISSCLRGGDWKKTLTATAKLPAQYMGCF